MMSIGVKDRAKLRRKSGGGKKAQPIGAKSESSLHWHVAGLLTKHLAPPAWFTTFPAGGGGEMRGKILKGLGLKAGIPDILIVNPVVFTLNAFGASFGAAPYDVTAQLLYLIELKKLGKGVLSDDQIATQGVLSGMGCRIANCESLDMVKAALMEWRLPYRETTPTEGRFRETLQKTFGNLEVSD